MESALDLKLEQLRNIESAAGWVESDRDSDPMYNSFIRLMRLRKSISIMYLQEHNLNKKEELLDLFEHYNKQIRSIIGV